MGGCVYGEWCMKLLLLLLRLCWLVVLCVRSLLRGAPCTWCSEWLSSVM